MENETDASLRVVLGKLEELVKFVKEMRHQRRLMEFPAGHPEEPAALKAWREQNPREEQR